MTRISTLRFCSRLNTVLKKYSDKAVPHLSAISDYWLLIVWLIGQQSTLYLKKEKYKNKGICYIVYLLFLV